MNTRPRSFLILLVPVAIGLASCGSSGSSSTDAASTGSTATGAPTLAKPPNAGSDGYDRSNVQKKIEEAQTTAAPGVDVGAAVCPDKVDLAVDKQFTCNITVGGVLAPYTVTITAGDGSGGKGFNAEPAKAIISVASVKTAIAAEAEKQGFSGATVDCGAATVVVQDPGSTFPCTVTQSSGDTQTLTVTVTDTSGHVTFG